MALTGRSQGGAGKAAVVASALMGTVSGFGENHAYRVIKTEVIPMKQYDHDHDHAVV